MSPMLRDAAGSLRELTFPADVGNATGPSLSSLKGLSSLSTVQLALLSLQCSGVGVRGEMKKESKSNRDTGQNCSLTQILQDIAEGHPPAVRLQASQSHLRLLKQMWNLLQGPCKEGGRLCLLCHCLPH